jgi:hypothetical protein
MTQVICGKRGAEPPEAQVSMQGRALGRETTSDPGKPPAVPTQGRPVATVILSRGFLWFQCQTLAVTAAS